uniref:Uncharacterized protein n=1 Tax=Chrysotila carterae TaxID=13221 RepID=A0A7S4BX52_CHRCT
MYYVSKVSSLRSHIVFLREAVFRSNPLRSHLYVVAENGRRLITSGDVAAHGRKTCHKQRNSAILSTGQLASTFALMVFDHADSLSQLRLAVVAVVFIGATVWFELQRSADLQDGSAFSRLLEQASDAALAVAMVEACTCCSQGLLCSALRWLGDRSWNVYLGHILVLNVAVKFPTPCEYEPWIPRTAAPAVFVAASIAAGAAFAVAGDAACTRARSSHT